MSRFKIVFIFLLSIPVFSQDDKNSIFTPDEIGVLFNYTTEENFLFNDPDYTYKAYVLKFQGFYDLKTWGNTGLQLIISPQIHNIQHQLVNEQFVTPAEPDYLNKRNEFTQLKTLTLLGVEFGISLKQKIFSKLQGVLTAGLGIAHIDRRTERLASGFTFIENGSLGLLYEISSKYQLYSGIQIGHVSNFDFKHPNSGYNNLGAEFGIRYQLQR
ncbi:MAG: hypothetical protein CMB99_14350 [Flavobacteriaceae bacterium]|nr:hypothetical protein [Flavobacteriaceae bacterium]